MPANVGFWPSSSHIAFGSALGQQYDPLQGNSADFNYYLGRTNGANTVICRFQESLEFYTG